MDLLAVDLMEVIREKRVLSLSFPSKVMTVIFYKHETLCTVFMTLPKMENVPGNGYFECPWY